MEAYYNENDPHAAAWLENLARARLISGGKIDARSIKDVRPNDLLGFRRAHFFAGVAGWELALQLAGWPEDRQVWTGSCPCQPFSQAGRRRGFADERHLWPVWFPLIAERKPPTILGEQVDSPAGRLWLDGIQADLESIGYAFAAASLNAAGIGAPHIRQRLYWVADTGCARKSRRISARPGSCEEEKGARTSNFIGGRGSPGGLADTVGRRLAKPSGKDGQEQRRNADGFRTGGRLGESDGVGQPGEPRGGAGLILADGRPDGGSWGQAVWITGQDGKARRIEPGIMPLAPRLPGDVGKIRAYGNAIVPELAAEFIKSFLEATMDSDELNQILDRGRG